MAVAQLNKRTETVNAEKEYPNGKQNKIPHTYKKIKDEATQSLKSIVPFSKKCWTDHANAKPSSTGISKNGDTNSIENK
jgi:hypothetical protein